MEIQTHRQGNLSYVVADNFFDPTELVAIKKEILDIKRFAALPASVGAAIDDDNKVIKNGGGVFLDEIYRTDRAKSEVLTYLAKLFDPEFVKIICAHDASFAHLGNSTKDTTLVNYYSSGGYYHPHKDATPLTAIWFGGIGEFSGGDFIFHEQQVTIKSVENRLVLFHGCVDHGVTPIVAEEGNFRISIAKFIGYKQ